MEVIVPYWWFFGLVAAFFLTSSIRFGFRVLTLTEVKTSDFGNKWSSHRIHHSVEMKATWWFLILAGISATTSCVLYN